jgi:hypothetical protein
VIRSRESIVAEVGCIWFYHTIGSGIFIDTSGLKNIQVLDKRTSWNAHNRYPWLGDSHAEKSMRQNRLDLVVFMTYEHAFAPPRTEIILLLPEVHRECAAAVTDATKEEAGCTGAVNMYKGYGPKKENCVPVYKQNVLTCAEWPDPPARATRQQVYAERNAVAKKMQRK